MSTCKQCQSAFEITDEDRAFYERVSPEFGGKKYLIPEPTLCPMCREQQRLAWKNDRKLYKRTCDLCGAKTFSVYAPESPYKVYCLACWYSDKWDPMEYGMDFDFTQPFFSQFHTLSLRMPKQALHHNNNAENCEYTTATTRNKNCYLISSSGFNEDCYYGIFMPRNKNCVDCMHVMDSELLYECVDADRCYHLSWCQNVKGCSNSTFLYDCHDCSDCFFSYGLRGKKFVFRNKQLSEEVYHARLKEIDFTSHGTVRKQKEEFAEFIKNAPRLYFDGQNNENVTASNNIFNSKNCTYCFDCENLEDCHYCGWLNRSRDCRDTYAFGYNDELCYFTLQIGTNAHRIVLSMSCWDNVSEMLYCNDCHAAQNLFACEGLRHKQYCIFNKQYTKKEYEALTARIIAHMQTTGEWGKFFPAAISCFAYNESMAMDMYPLTRDEGLSKGFVWRDTPEEIPTVEKIIPADKLPDRTTAIPDDVLNWALRCEATGRPFRLIPQELRFYRQQNLPIPHLHPEERYRRRFAQRNPRKIYDRKCAKCATALKTTYSPDRPEKVYCETCYLKTVY